MEINTIIDNKLSYYRTTHCFKRYGEFFTLEEFSEYCKWAQTNNTKIYILGNGSNTLFRRNKIQSLILKNKLNQDINPISQNRVEISSSVSVIDVLKYCYTNSLDSFYYLASVPATIGGALAMNAGRGRKHNLTIYDFVESITFFDFESNSIKTFGKEEVVKGYRNTIFTGIKSLLILNAVFYFPSTTLNINPIVERCKWSKKEQDNSAPNCGSVFKEADSQLLQPMRGVHIGNAWFSPKTNNWILNKASSSIYIIMLIAIVKLLHFLRGKRAILEIIIVD